jgi:hypothetical protein
LGPGEAVHGLAVLHDHHRRQAAHAELLRDHLLLVGVDLGQQERAGILRRQLLEDRHQRLAGSTPVSPEVDDHRALHGFIDEITRGVALVDGDYCFRCRPFEHG